MASTNNDDFLSRVQLTAAHYLERDPYFTPEQTGTENQPVIPVVSMVQADVETQIKTSGNVSGLLVVVALGDCQFTPGGGTLATDKLTLLVRVREVTGVSKNNTGARENCLRVAQKAAWILNTKIAALSTDGTPMRMGGTLSILSITQGMRDERLEPEGCNVWIVTVAVTGGGLTDFTRRNQKPAAGSP